MKNKFRYERHSTVCCCMSEQTIYCDRKFCMVRACSHKLLMTVFVLCHFKTRCVCLFRFEANGNYLFSTFSIVMYGDNSHIDDLKILTAIEIYLHSGFYRKHPSFISLISKHVTVFSSIDTLLAASVSHNALESNKTKGELVTYDAINIIFFF